MSGRTIATLLRSKKGACILWALLLTSFLSVSAVDPTCEDEDITRPMVTVPQGTVEGINMLTRRNRTVFGFLGVPYAKPPIGELRFKAAVAPDPWDGILDASHDTEPCLQRFRTLSGNEDCLHHNIFTPKLPTNEDSPLLPVMVEIIGGGLLAENNSVALFNPDLLLDEDVVLIVPNYRVGVLGFLSTGDEAAPGNYGLKDFVRVLEWIQENIHYFGGDPNRVTLFGGSSGGTCVHLLALSNLTDGLIHRFITQSGTAGADVSVHSKELSLSNTIKLAEYFDCPINTSAAIVDCLRNIDGTELLASGPSSLFAKWQVFPGNVWLPTVESDVEGALITDTPVNLLANGKIRDLPWLSTINRDDGVSPMTYAFYQSADVFDDFLNRIDFALPILLSYDNLLDDPTAYTNALKSYYLNDLTADKALLLANLTLLAGDAVFIYPAYRAVKRQAELAQSSVFAASFDYRGVFTQTYQVTGNISAFPDAVAHGDDIIFLFDNHANYYGPPDLSRTENDWIMVDRMVQLWTSFAATGIPTTVEANDTVEWEPYTSQNNYLRIGDLRSTAFEIKYDINIERMRFWDELTETFGT